MDDETVKLLFENGATIVIHDFPSGGEIGIDYKSWYTGDNFKGIKMIPPGFHFLFYSIVNEQQQHSGRKGVFLLLEEKDIAVFRWDQSTEEIKKEIIDEDQTDYYRTQKRSLDSSLGPYPFEKYKIWKTSTKHITPDIITRVQPHNGVLTPSTEVNCESIPMENKSKEDIILKTNLDSAKALNFSIIPSARYPNNAKSSAITTHCLDRSFVLNSMLTMTETMTDELSILGEMQIAFISFVIGQVYDAFEYWKALVVLLTSCETALHQRPNLFMKFIDVMYFELQEIPEDFFVDIVAQTNFLVRSFQTFFSFFKDDNSTNKIPQRVHEKCSKLRTFLASKFNWSFEDEFDDDAPVVVNFGDTMY